MKHHGTTTPLTTPSPSPTDVQPSSGAADQLIDRALRYAYRRCGHIARATEWALVDALQALATDGTTAAWRPAVDAVLRARE